MKQDTDCKVCGKEAWDDAPVQLCRVCVIQVGAFVASQRRLYFDRIMQDAMVDSMLTSKSWRDSCQVYYLQWGDRIKIGASMCPAKRALALSMDPANIVATEPGGFPRERERHQQFADLRIEGEWFAAGDDLLAHIETLAVA